MDNKELVILAAKKGGPVTPGTMVIVSGQMTEAQAEQFRENIGAVSADDIGNVFTIKGSVATVADLPATGNSVGDVYYVEAVSAGYVWITSTEHPSGYWEELGEPIDLSAYELKPTVVHPTGSAVSITPVDNHYYDCGEPASLTISNSPAHGIYTVVFVSGATPTHFVVDPPIEMPDGFAVNANTRYEISVKNGYALVGRWAVGS